MKSKLTWFATAAAVVAGMAPSAHAQQTAPTPTSTTAQEAASDEVIVTARKREERLIDVPISMQVLSAEEIQASGIDDIRDIATRSGFQLIPQVSTGPAGRSSGNIIFRGLQANSFGQSRDNSGSLFIDGIYVAGGQQGIDTTDVQRIEVLKGPQNAFFGRGTFGGAVNFITRNPSDEYAGKLNVEATDIGSSKVDGSVEGAIIPGMLTGRLSVLLQDRAAQNKADDGGELGAEKTRGLTGTLYFTPTTDLWFRTRVHYQQDDDSGANIGLLRASVYGAPCTGQTFPGFNGRTGGGPITLARNYFCNGIPTADQTGTGFITQNTVIPGAFATALANNAFGAGGTQRLPFLNSVPSIDHYGLRRDYLHASVQGGYEFEGADRLEFNAGTNQSNQIAISDIDRTNAANFLEAQLRLTQDVTLDARYISDPGQRLRYLIGASHFWQRERISQASQAFGGTVGLGAFQHETFQTEAAYGSIDFDILKNLTLTVDGRYQEDTFTIRTLPGPKFEQTEDSFLPRVSVSYHPVHDLNVYATYAEGRQPPTGNTSFAGLNSAQQSYVQSNFPGVSVFSITPELESYEIGVKQRIANNFQYSVAAYQLDWSNAVTTSSLFNPASCFGPPVVSLTAACPLAVGGTSVTTPNDARIRGVEVEVSGNLTPAWSVVATLDYKDAKWVRYANTGFNAFAGLSSAAGDVYRADGNGMSRVPEFSGTLSSTYTVPLTAGWQAYARGDLVYTGEAWDSELNIVKTDAYSRVNAHLGFVHGPATVELFANNLFDDNHWDSAALTVAVEGDFTQRALLVQPALKREIGVRASFNF